MKTAIQHMVCPRCVESVEQIIDGLQLPVESVELGEASFKRKLSDQEKEEFSQKLSEKGFELSQDREEELVSRVKSSLLKYMNHLEEVENPKKLSVFIAEEMNLNYSYLSHIFSESEGQTGESRFIEVKVERTKELLSYNKWTLSEIAWKLKYSSVQYLSNQFKKVTGMTVTEYRAMAKKNRKSLDEI